MLLLLNTKAMIIVVAVVAVDKLMKKTEYFPYAFFEGKILPTENAKINIMTNAFQYGNAVFGGIRGYMGKDKKLYIFRLSDHYKRFWDALKILNKTINYSHKQLISKTLELADKNKPATDCYFRPIAYGARFGLSPDLYNLDFDFAIYMIPLGEYLPLTRGLKLIVSNWTRVGDNVIPARGKISGSYVNSSLAKGEAARMGFDDALMMTADGHITEGSSSNFFMLRDGVLITAPKYSDVLEGITRKTILQLAKDLKIPIEERPIDRTEVYIADEAFLSGTGAQVAWIEEIDGRKIGNRHIGSITAKLQNLFFDIVRGKEKKYSSWSTKV